MACTTAGKMRSRKIAIALLGLTAACASTHPIDETATVTVTGCVTKGVEAGCWLLTSTQGATYSLHTEAKVEENRAYRVRGEVGGFDTCMQGAVLNAKAADVTPVEMKCP